jgi:hypothetical protein
MGTVIAALFRVNRCGWCRTSLPTLGGWCGWCGDACAENHKAGAVAVAWRGVLPHSVCSTLAGCGGTPAEGPKGGVPSPSLDHPDPV